MADPAYSPDVARQVIEAHGLIDPSTLTDLQSRGISFKTILALILKHGPAVVDIIKVILADIRLSESVPPA